MNDELELDLGKTHGTGALKVLRVKGAHLSAAQVEFNRLMKRLENERQKYAREEARLDRVLDEYITVVMPRLERLKRVNMEMVFESAEIIDIIKLSARRLQLFTALLCGKATDLLRDPSGLSEDELEKLREILERLNPSAEDEDDDYDDYDLDDLEDLNDQNEFDMLRAIIEEQAKLHGVDLDLDGLDMTDDPEEFERQLRERLENALEPTRKRKPTKAQLEKEKKRQQVEEAKTRNFKTLFKQLAKLLHPDLETDHAAKGHKEAWMKRLTTAYEAGDLREMLQIEMEWFGGMQSELSGASDEKLLAYNMVLKEQISEVKEQIQTLLDRSKYQVLMRFTDDFTGELQNPARVAQAYEEDARRHEAMLQILKARNTTTKKAVGEWADEHGRRMARPDWCPF